VLAWGGKGTDAGEFDEPVGVAAGPMGAIYVADSLNNRIQKFMAQTPALSAGQGRTRTPFANGSR